MKLFLSLFLVLLSLTSFSQFKVSDGSEFDIDPPRDISAYEIYFKPLNANKLSLFLKVEVENGLKKKITEMEEGKIKSVQYNFYQDSLLQKAIVKYNDPKATEIWYYRYDSISHEEIFSKGYKNNKLIYSYIKNQNNNTTEIKEKFDDWWNKSNNVTSITLSGDGLTETSIVRTDNGVSPRFTIKNYTASHNVKSEVDSSSEWKEFIKYDSFGRIQKRVNSSKYHEFPNTFSYTYDSIGRVKKETIIADSIFTRITEHTYSNIGHLAICYLLTNETGDSVICWKTITRFDNNQNEISKEEIRFNEELHHSEIVERILSKKTYRNNRIIKFKRTIDLGSRILEEIYVVNYYNTLTTAH